MHRVASALQRFADRLLARSTLTQEEVEAILDLKGAAFQARPNYDIVSPGESVHAACLIVAGLVGRFEQMQDGARQITAVHIAGDMCDLHSVVIPTMEWRLQALTTTTYLRIPHTELRRLAREFPALAEAFWRDCAVDAAMLSQWVINTGRREAICRCSHLLCEVALRSEYAGLGSRTSFPLEATQAHLGDMLALSAVHVNRTLQSLRRMKLIGMAGRHVEVHDWDELAALGDFDASYLQFLERPFPRTLLSA
jgi:CRP-like cAMP-binding protein